MSRKFKVYTEKVETFVIEIEAENAEEAEKLADDDSIDSNDWKSVDSSEKWNLLIGETEEIKKEEN